MWFGKAKGEKKEDLSQSLQALKVERTEGEKGVRSISIDSIVLNPYQPRKNIDAESLEELASSIKEVGVLQPIIVREIGENRYELIAGERRWRAARLAGLSYIPAMVVEATDKEALSFALVENLQRSDLNPIEEAYGYKRLMQEFDLTQEEIAQMVGKKQSTIANKLRLLRLPLVVQEKLMDGTITERHARALLKLSSESDMIKALKQIEQRKLNVNQTEELVDKMLGLISREMKERESTPQTLEDLYSIISKTLSKFKKYGLTFNVILDEERNELRISFLRGEGNEEWQGSGSR
ncbi:MAG: ParB/RepB/Spo0J family partition protein [Synergistetes bacterium]|nr:ParB/RepB/Spo0J family partition protein [Synergistota bacterium]MDW8191761.1 ParB/RepB/Spo0J family partition protein [Synergistota bacterium]